MQAQISEKYTRYRGYNALGLRTHLTMRTRLLDRTQLEQHRPSEKHFFVAVEREIDELSEIESKIEGVFVC
jgi:hypothetical protein